MAKEVEVISRVVQVCAGLWGVSLKGSEPEESEESRANDMVF